MKRALCCLLMLLLAIALPAQAEFVFSDATVYEEAPGETEAGMVMTDAAGDAVQKEAPVVSEAPVNEGWPRQIVVTVGGDCTLGTTDSLREREDSFDKVVAEKGYDWPFSQLLTVFGQDDLTLVNFEGPLTEGKDKVDKKFNFKGPAEYAQMLVSGSVEAVTLANNHYGDYGDEGKDDTRAALNSYGITYCAPGETAVYEARGVKIGLIGNTFPYADGKRDISKTVKALRDEGCQIVLASFHWGSEYEYAFNRDQRNIGRAAIKSGADAVIGHHPHVIQGIEAYEDTYILYSLGNLVFGGNVDPDDRDTFIAQLTFTVYEDGRVEGPALKLLPMRLTAEAKGTDYRPVFAEDTDTYERILNKILSRSTNMEGFVNPN